MTSTDAAAQARETVYAAIELSKKTWVLGIAPPDRDRPSIYRISGGNIAELLSRLRVASKNNRRSVVCYGNCSPPPVRPSNEVGTFCGGRGIYA